MTCDHKRGDPDCSSHPDNPRDPNNYNKYTTGVLNTLRDPKTPDKNRYEIVDVQYLTGRNNAYLILKVKYPNCAACAYEGTKVMVFQDVTMEMPLKWNEIDPHFRENPNVKSPKAAPSPIARFPSSKEGWDNAIKFVEYRLSLVSKP